MTRPASGICKHCGNGPHDHPFRHAYEEEGDKARPVISTVDLPLRLLLMRKGLITEAEILEVEAIIRDKTGRRTKDPPQRETPVATGQDRH
jgi:hypothetical protein